MAFNRSLNSAITGTTPGTGNAVVVRTASTNGDVVIGMRITNTSASAIKVCAYVCQATDAAASNRTYLIGGETVSSMGADVPVGGALVVINGDIDKVVLNNGDFIKVFASTASACNVIVSVLEN